MTYTSSKVIELGSTAFRQPNADSHCKYLHGYQLKAELTFGCEKLDNNNWVFDFGGLKQLKEIFNNQFDHTTVISGLDPDLDTFKDLQDKNIIQLRILETGVGIEKFAEWVYKTADTYIEEVTEGRVWVESVTVFEHGNNFASCSKGLPVSPPVPIEEDTKTHVEVKEDNNKDEAPAPAPDQTPEDTHNPRAAQVGNRVTPGKGNWFAGTTWGD